MAAAVVVVPLRRIIAWVQARILQKTPEKPPNCEILPQIGHPRPSMRTCHARNSSKSLPSHCPPYCTSCRIYSNYTTTVAVQVALYLNTILLKANENCCSNLQEYRLRSICHELRNLLRGLPRKVTRTRKRWPPFSKAESFLRPFSPSNGVYSVVHINVSCPCLYSHLLNPSRSTT